MHNQQIYMEAFQDVISTFKVSEDVIMSSISEALCAAYKKTYGEENTVTTKIEDGVIHLYATRTIVDNVRDEALEISIDEAKRFIEDCEIGQQVMVEVNPSSFGLRGTEAARQVLKQKFREIKKDAIYTEYKDKIYNLITGRFQRERYGDIYLDLGRCEALLPRTHRLPNDRFGSGDHIKAVIIDVSNDPNKHTSVIISRTHATFVERIFELEVPEIADGIVEIKKVVREPGYRTKIAVYSEIVDPVGACVGPKGIRIQNITAQLMGEKVDIIPWSAEIRELITAALTPSEVERVLVVDHETRQAVAVVHEDQLAKAIGKNGRNVRLAAQLIEWSLDVKTPARASEEGISDVDYGSADLTADDIWGQDGYDISLLGLEPESEEALRRAGLDFVEALIDYDAQELIEATELSAEQVKAIQDKLEEMVEIEDPSDSYQETESKDADEVVREDDTQQIQTEQLSQDTEQSQITEKVVETDDESQKVAATETKEDQAIEEDDDYIYLDVEQLECPQCGGQITLEMKNCPSCGVALEFEVLEDDEESEIEGDES